MICPKKLKILKKKVKHELKFGNFSSSETLTIDKLNSILRTGINYYLVSSYTYKQLNSLRLFMKKYFYKSLLRKYCSKPKVHSFINRYFCNKENFCVNSKGEVTTSFF